MLQLDQIYMYGGCRQKSDNMGQRFFTTSIISHMAKLPEKFDTGLQHCPCVDKFSSQLDCCWTSVQHISDKTACWNIRPNICLILPCFTAHQAHTPPPAGRAPPLTVEPDKKRGKVPDFLSLTTWRQRIIFVVFISVLKWLDALRGSSPARCNNGT